MSKGTNYSSTNLTATTGTTATTVSSTTGKAFVIKQHTANGWVTYNPVLGGQDGKPNVETLLPDKVIFQDDKETVVIKKGNKTHYVRNHDDNYDRVYGFLLAFFQMNSGLSKNKANKYLESLRKIPKQEVKK